MTRLEEYALDHFSDVVNEMEEQGFCLNHNNIDQASQDFIIYVLKEYVKNLTSIEDKK